MQKKLTRELAAGKPAEEAGKVESKSAEGAAKPAESSKKDDLSGTDLTTTAGGEKEKPPEPEDEKK